MRTRLKPDDLHRTRTPRQPHRPLCRCDPGGGRLQQAQKPAITGNEQSVAAQMVAAGSEHAENFLHHSQTVGIRNMLGGARAVFMSPGVTGGAAIVGYETGTGFLMQRHGEQWSDPVFFTLSGTRRWIPGRRQGGKSPRPAHVRCRRR